MRVSVAVNIYPPEIGKPVRASVRDSVWDRVAVSVAVSVWDSVRASVGDRVWDIVRGLR